MNAGKLDRRVRFEQDTGITDDVGGHIPAWSTVVDRVPAQIRYLDSRRGDEKMRQQQMQSQVIVEVTIRYRPTLNISAGMQIVYGSRIFNIRSVSSIDENLQFVKIRCEELQAKGSNH